MKRDKTEIKEKKAANFKRLAESRTQKILDQLRLIGNLSNTSAYEYSDDQVKKIFAAIRAEVDNTEKRFHEKSDNDDKFIL